MSLNRIMHGQFWSIQSTLKGIGICVLASTIFVAGIAGNALTVHADGAEESPHGAIFRRKGWITPAIYKKPQRAEAEKAKKSKPRVAKKAPTKTKKKITTTARKVAKGKRSSKLRSAATTRLPNSSRLKRSAKRRIPARVVKRRERKLRRANRQKTNPKAYAVKIASLGVDLLSVPKSVARKLGLRKRKRSVTGGGRLIWRANRKCLTPRLRAVISHIALNYGRVRVNSTCRSRKHNRRVGGASRSWHLTGRAADIRVFGNIRKAARYMRRVVGGFKHYGGGLFHIDTGPRRSW